MELICAHPKSEFSCRVCRVSFLAHAAHQEMEAKGAKGVSVDGDLRRCAASGCDKPGSLGACQRCRQVSYCSTSCQKTHWKEGGHKSVCKPLSSAAGAEAGIAQTKTTGGTTATSSRAATSVSAHRTLSCTAPAPCPLVLIIAHECFDTSHCTRLCGARSAPCRDRSK